MVESRDNYTEDLFKLGSLGSKALESAKVSK
jgi:hypothetical protein